MPILHLVIAADGLDATKLCELLIAVGVTPANIHIPPGHSVVYLRALGVKSDLPRGPIVILSKWFVDDHGTLRGATESIDYLVVP